MSVPDENRVPELLSPRPRMERIGDAVRLYAPAKLNLNLLVGPRRADGFHPLDSLVAKVTLYDEIDIRPREDGRITFSCGGADCGDDEKNLALRAARLLAGAAEARGMGILPMRATCVSPVVVSEAPESAGAECPCGTWAGRPCHVRSGVDITLAKHIQPGKGMGGGSSDAAAVLWGLNSLWKMQLPIAELARLATTLGSDVPLFLGPPCSRMTGRGEHMAPIAVHPFVAIVFAGDFFCGTSAVYQAFDSRPAQAAAQLHPAELASQPPSQWRGRLVNQLAPAAREVCPALGSVWSELSAAVDIPVCLTGSGSALFMLCDDLAEARRAFAYAGRAAAKLPVGPAEHVVDTQ